MEGGLPVVIQWLRLRAPNAGGQVSIPDEGTTSHIPQLKIPHATAETWSSQRNKYFKKLSILKHFNFRDVKMWGKCVTDSIKHFHV